MTTFSLLIVEDDSQTAQMVRLYLEQAGFVVGIAADGPSGEAVFRRQQPQLVVLDILLPGFDGLELCRRIRSSSMVPIFMLTARSEDIDKAIGLGIGADDYLAKPFSPTELVARVKALLRRAYHYNEPVRPPILGGPKLRLDSKSRHVLLDGQPIELTATEFDLLQVLMAHPGWVFTREHLLERIWGFADEAGEETITAHMSNIRRKLGPGGAFCLRTVRGVGYAYEEEV